MTEAQELAVEKALSANPWQIAKSASDRRYVQELPNGLVCVRDAFGWLYLRPDGSKHSRQF